MKIYVHMMIIGLLKRWQAQTFVINYFPVGKCTFSTAYFVKKKKKIIKSKYVGIVTDRFFEKKGLYFLILPASVHGSKFKKSV